MTDLEWTSSEKIKDNGPLEGDQHGKQGSHNAIDPKLIDAVHDHIHTLNVCSSHYDIEGKVASKLTEYQGPRPLA